MFLPPFSSCPSNLPKCQELFLLFMIFLMPMQEMNMNQNLLRLCCMIHQFLCASKFVCRGSTHLPDTRFAAQKASVLHPQYAGNTPVVDLCWIAVMPCEPTVVMAIEAPKSMVSGDLDETSRQCYNNKSYSAFLHPDIQAEKSSQNICHS